MAPGPQGTHSQLKDLPRHVNGPDSHYLTQGVAAGRRWKFLLEAYGENKWKSVIAALFKIIIRFFKCAYIMPNPSLVRLKSKHTKL